MAFRRKSCRSGLSRQSSSIDARFRCIVYALVTEETVTTLGDFHLRRRERRFVLVSYSMRNKDGTAQRSSSGTRLMFKSGLDVSRGDGHIQYKCFRDILGRIHIAAEKQAAGKED